tara:strand:+ start:142 stop:483 length:342 start_codon:yes stop_codon:yes gene_type:complete
MNKVLSKATEHYKAQITGGMKSIDVPEWEAKIYYKPVMTLADQAKILEYHNKGNLVDALIETLITRAKTEDGKQMFQQGQRSILKNEVDPEIITRVVTEMNAGYTKAEAELGN